VRRALRLAALAPLALAAACSSYNPLVWVGIMSTPANPPTPLTPIEAKVTPRAVWSASVGKSKGFNLRPAIDQGKVYAAAADGTVTVVAEDTGKQLERFDTQKPIAGGLEVADGRIFAGTMKGEVLALDAGGKSLWTAKVAGEVIAPASVSRNIAVVRTADGRIFAYAIADGRRLWVYQRPTPSLLLRSSAGVLAVGGDVVAGYPNGKLVALDLDDGKLTWEATVALPKGSTELERIADVAGLPVIDGSNVCAGAFQGKVACFDISTRNAVWSRDISTARALVTDAKNLYVVDDTGSVQALDKRGGSSVWKQDKLKYRQLTAPVVFDGRVIVGDGYGYLHVLSPDDGALIGRLAIDGSPVVALVPGLSALFAQTAGGSLVAVRF
jgi:outer membrane protein assembly factor BamB